MVDTYQPDYVTESTASASISSPSESEASRKRYDGSKGRSNGSPKYPQEVAKNKREESVKKSRHRPHRSSSRHSQEFSLEDPRGCEKRRHHRSRNRSKSHETMSDDNSQKPMKPQSWSHHPQNKSRKSRENRRSTSRRRRSSTHETKDSPSSHSSKRSDKSRRSVTPSNPVSRRKRVESNTSSRSSISSRWLESTSEELRPTKPVSTGALWPEHHSQGFDIENTKGSRRERRPHMPSSRTLSKDSELELSNLGPSAKKTGAKCRSKSVDEIGVSSEAMDERVKAKEKYVRSRKSQPSSDRDMKHALKIGYLSLSDSDDSSDDGSLMVDIMDQRSKAKEKSFRHRINKPNDRNRKRRTRSPPPSIQSVPGAYSSNGNSTSQRRRPDKGGEGERAKDMAASLRSDHNSAAAISRKTRRSGLLLGAHANYSDDEMAKPSKKEHEISLELEAHVADEENPEVEAIKAENERLRRQMTAENRRLRQQMTSHNDQDRRQSSGDISRTEIVVATATGDSDKRTVEKKRKRKRYFLGLLFCILVLLGVTGGAVFASTSESTDFGIVATDSPSTGPSGVSSIPPTITMLCDPPSEEDCRSVQDGAVVDDQEAMIDFSVVVDFEVVLIGDVERSEWLQELLERLTTYLIPYLVGCYDEGLPITSNRYIFGNANATGYDDPETCERETELPCYAVAVNLDLSLKGNAQISSLVSLLETLIGSDGSGNSLTVRLGLSDNFNDVSLTGVTSQTPTFSPIAIPGSSVPSLSPSQPLSSVPTWFPVQGQTTNTPTPPPTLRPTITATPNPTTISSVPTQSPTKIQTLSPTPALTPIPTLSPTRTTVATTSPPAPAPTSNPTRRPTPAPPPPPTFTPTAGPTPNPTPEPTPLPTPSQTPNPTPGSTQSGTFSPSSRFAPGSSCCSNNLKDCDVVDDWCHENVNQCTGPCNGNWLVVGSCPADGIVKDGECTSNVNDCCAPATCDTINQFYSQCRV